jgi:phage/plasmid-like protein (TIGR03299 family)
MREGETALRRGQLVNTNSDEPIVSKYLERVILMAHNIEMFADGTSAFFANREPAWHNLGVVTPNALTAQEALETAQLDWQVKVSENPVGALVDNKILSVPEKFVTYREHPKLGLGALGVVGNRYTPIQNADAFEFLNYLSDDSGAKFETAGSLNDGARVFMTMKFPESMTIAGVDTINQYIMAINSHDGSSSFTVAVTPIRAVCTNTVRLALNNAVSKISLKHTAGSTAKVQQARETLGVVFRYQEEFEREVNSLLDLSMNEAEFGKFVEKLVPAPHKDASERQKNSIERKRAEITALWNAPTQKIVAGTAWAAYNAVVEWADWAQTVRGGENPNTVRAERNILGATDAIKNKAHALLLA